MQSADEKDLYPELLTPVQMQEADRQAAAAGPYDDYGLMRNAGAAIMATIRLRYPAAKSFDILCGPGNNGGDGYEVARLLVEAGFSVTLWQQAAPRPGSAAERAAQSCPLVSRPLAGFVPTNGRIIIDALYGAGLDRGLKGEAAAAAQVCNETDAQVIALDLPSGLSGKSGKPLGPTFRANLTVTFFRLKPGHLLEPGRGLCGDIIVADIGISTDVLATISPRTFINLPALWQEAQPLPQRGQHKYSRGHVAVFSGGPTSSGAARLSAMAAARIGAGAVTLYAPASALLVNATHLTSIMLRQVDTPQDFCDAAALRQPDAVVLGPGFGLERPLQAMALAVLAQEGPGTLVLDADGLTAFRDQPDMLFSAIAASRLDVILTPHEGEFGRLFPDLVDDKAASKLERARKAAQQAGATIVLKGPDTVIASPDGRAAINANGTPLLATAGSGDVLAGLIAGLAAQKMPAWQAACMAVWVHAQAATNFGPGLIAEDLPGLIPSVLREFYQARRDCSAIAPKGARGLPAVMK